MSISYELVEQLEKNGFKSKESCSGYVVDKIHHPIPTLSELIEACGSDFDYLSREDYTQIGVSWRAQMTDKKFDEIDDYGCVVDCCGYESGDTPEEAVANLWLEINKTNE